MKHFILTAPNITPIEIQVIQRERGPIVQGRQLPDILSFTCAQMLQFNAGPTRAEIRDETGQFYDFQHIEANPLTLTFRGYIKPVHR